MLYLRPYQTAGAEWLASKRFALLADEMGVGKSAQAIRACDLVGAMDVLVICPANARVNWQREFARFGTRDVNLKIVSYEHATKNRHVGKPDVLILDEAHYLKSATSKRTVNIMGKTGVVHDAGHVWALTGTPAPNNVAELWPFLFTSGAYVHNYDTFVQEFCNSWREPVRNRLVITGTKDKPAFKKLLEPLMMRRLKKDVATEMPSITFSDVFVTAGPVDHTKHFTKYINLKDFEDRSALDAQLAVEDKLIRATHGDLTTMLLMDAKRSSTLRRYVGLQKVDAVGDMVAQELKDKAYSKLVIFAIHRGVIETLRERFAKQGVVTLYGGTPPEKKQYNIDRFQTDEGCRIFIGNIQAAGTAISLTAAHNVLFAETDWVPGNNAQAAMRVHRIGQTNPVSVRFAVLPGSIDDAVMVTVRRKAFDLAAVFDDFS